MAFRTIDTDIWNNAWFYDLTPAQKTMYIFLFSNPQVSNIGVLEISRKQFAATTGVSLSAGNKFLEELENSGHIVTDEKFILLVNFIAKQTHFGNDSEKNRNDKLLKNLNTLWGKCPSAKIKQILQASYPTIFQKFKTSSAADTSPSPAQGKPLRTENEAPYPNQTSHFPNQNNPLGCEREGEGGDIGDIGDIGEKVDPPLTPLAGGNAAEGTDVDEIVLPGQDVQDTETGTDSEAPAGTSPSQEQRDANAERLEPSQTAQGEETGGPEKKPRRRKTYDYRNEDFQTWWDAYPVHEGEKPAKAEWDRLIKNGRLPDLEALMKALAWQKESRRWRDGYVYKPVRYLKEEHFNDEPPAPQRTSYAPDANGRTPYIRPSDEGKFKPIGPYLPKLPNGQPDYKDFLRHPEKYQGVV